MKPVIGIICGENGGKEYFLLRQVYVQALENAGALPVLLPLTEKPDQVRRYLSLCRGLVFSGGGDISPDLWPVPAEKKSFCTSVDLYRDICELFMLRQALRLGTPLLGICRGCQLLNVAQGGTLTVHLKEELGHMQSQARAVPTHPLELEPHTLLNSLAAGTTPWVNSFHHQAIARLGREMQVAARTPDGVIEAVEHICLPFCIGVQWHPEDLEDAFTRGIFSALVQSAAALAR